ncbi:efflux RND transporter periplasmic adaptor subunit [Reichenbachiella sp. MSK19-1]|uniref:efflux RND transporter periplasmic adaptor subunit n=1 Tax=Reichenbachiella sp. MSK19-1 TaxID=1897631 RepID=UPI000E6B8233|nr:efflux RND transporter periplasmic adaptor subunit [Reichenbachiella sp. MSK19-1]RJE75404.1 efflux transporter periplasmic adaptor subunit [Reichenbachiella sp. MSK19-1]
MKNTVLILTVLFLVVGCGKNQSVSDLIEGADVEKIRERKNELSLQQKEIEAEIALLDEAIMGQSEEKYSLITTLQAKQQEFVHYVELRGDVATKKNVLIYPEVSGVLLKVYVEEGQSVKKGQLLATIDNGGAASQLQQMKTQLELSRTTYERQKRLWEQKIGTEIQYLQAESNYEAQKKSVEQMQSQLGKFRITAPFSGLIDDVIKDEGTVVAPTGPGSEVFRIINLSEMRIEVPVPENFIASIHSGTKVIVYFPVLDETVESTVKQTGNFINPNNRSFNVEIPVPNDNKSIKPNMTAQVRINDYSSPEAILIAQSVISENAEGEQYVYVATDITKENVAIAQKRIITTGKTQGDDVEILSGIKAGENIIQEGARSVKDGQKVKILTR